MKPSGWASTRFSETEVAEVSKIMSTKEIRPMEEQGKIEDDDEEYGTDEHGDDGAR